MKRKTDLFYILTHPFTLAFFITIGVIQLIPNIFNRYHLEELESDYFHFDQKADHRDLKLTDDLDSDGVSEMITCGIHPDENYDFFWIHDSLGGMACQINFLERLHPKCAPVTGFLNKNNLKDLVFLSHIDNKIYLNILYDSYKNGSCANEGVTTLFLDTINTNPKNDLGFPALKILDMDGDGSNDILIKLKTEWATQPRNFYLYNLKKDTIYKSPKSGGLFYGSLITCDHDQDGKMEIISGSRASANLPFDFPYTDQNAYLFGFDHELNYLFEPVIFPDFNSAVSVRPIKVKDSLRLAVLYQYKGNKEHYPELMLYDFKGNQIKNHPFKALEKSWKKALFTPYTNNWEKLYMLDENEILFEITDDLKLKSRGEFPLRQGSYNLQDIDYDDNSEIVFLNFHKKEVTVYRSDFSNPVKLSLKNKVLIGNPSVYPKRMHDDSYEFTLQTGGDWILMRYSQNPLYYLKYLIWLGVYISLAFLLWLNKLAWNYKMIQDQKKLEATIAEQTKTIVEEKAIIEKAHIELENKNTEILSSIKYAKRLQQAILPSENILKKVFPNSFILFQPRDIVSGDFYWLKNDIDKAYFAVADCTGHGIPGAMVSVVCSHALELATKESNGFNTADILEKTAKLVVDRFEKSEKEVNDGMDISFCCLDKKSNILYFSGAYNPLIIARKNSHLVSEKSDYINENHFLVEIKGTKRPVGKHQHFIPFEMHEIQLIEGDQIYLFTDGFIDQFGGNKGKKLKSKAFKQLLLDIASSPIQEQKDNLEIFIETWMAKGNCQQIDDICVMAIEIKDIDC